MIIGICGLIGAGKDTVADYLVNWYELDEDTNNLSVHGHMRLAQILHDKNSKELINTNKGL